MPDQPSPLVIPEELMGGSLYNTVFESDGFRKLLDREYAIGAGVLMEEILDKKLWSNEEILWIIKQMVYYYGGNDNTLKKAPTERIFQNMNSLLRALYLFVDRQIPDLDDNTRSYISAKLGDATWGITDKTRIYLQKMP